MIQEVIGERLTKITKLLELSIFRPDPRHISSQKRKRKSLAFSALKFLS
jgi:hypothetical protein